MTESASAMDRLLSSLRDGKSRGLPPVERWNPPFCGDIDMRIAADGTWFYLGTPIGRPALVKLFSSVLRKDGADYVLVTPVEKVGITVEDAPFQAVEMAVDGEGEGRSLAFRTQVDDLVSAGPGHAIRFERAAKGGLKPYIHVRRDLWARVTRAVTYDLLALGEVREVDGLAMFGVAAGGAFYPAVPASEIEDGEAE
ncbi:DUF1285 domain-containing protein [Bosea sp. 685]|uniref:DUF1285 domain-containing protein n=1 Tax=Bosea sp. 685 TaxID=3080057 RepID=UPI002892CC0F|nr:DUF1285 domain-containing protein [Bosea sp. 685]WNJ92080.1 DUF1285 domain-containing protein [Bosea sp. 685]